MRPRRRTVLAAAASGLAGCLGTPRSATIDAVDGAWTHPRGDPQGTRFAPDGCVPERTPAVAWRVSFGGEWGQVVVADGRVVIAGEGEVVALDATTGDEQWRQSLPSSADVAGPVLAEHCYLGVGSELRALSPDDGSIRWTVDSAGGEFRRIVSVDGSAYGTTRGHGDQSGSVYAVSEGERLWRYRTDEVPVRSFGSLAVADDAVHLVGENSGSATFHHALDRATGTERWTADGLNHSTALTVAGDAVLAGGFYGTVVSQARADGSERWSRERPPAVRQICAAPDWAYVASSRDEPGSLGAVSLADGSATWTADGHGVVGAGDGLVAVDDGTLRGYDRDSGERRWERAGGPDVRGMALADGVLFLVTEDGRVTALAT